MTGAPVSETAHLLGQLGEDICYLGASILPLYVDAATSADLRATLDVDAVVAVASYSHYLRVIEALSRIGFVQQVGDGIQRFHREALVLDLVPCPPSIVGMRNSWIQEGMAVSVTLRLTDDLAIKVFPAPYWLAAKISAFQDRGEPSCCESKDLEDIIALVDGRPGLHQEISELPDGPRLFILQWFGGMLDRDDINDLVAGLMPRSGGRGRDRVLIRRMRVIAGRGEG